MPISYVVSDVLVLYCVIELGDWAKSKLDSIRFTIVASLRDSCTVVCIVRCTRKIINSYFFGLAVNTQ